MADQKHATKDKYCHYSITVPWFKIMNSAQVYKMQAPDKATNFFGVGFGWGWNANLLLGTALVWVARSTQPDSKTEDRLLKETLLDENQIFSNISFHRENIPPKY